MSNPSRRATPAQRELLDEYGDRYSAVLVLEIVAVIHEKTSDLRRDEHAHALAGKDAERVLESGGEHAFGQVRRYPARAGVAIEAVAPMLVKICL